ncbi:MAG: DUF1987 domain-containing protein [bacterium]
MENLILEKTGNTPYVNFDFQKGILKICGRSIPENPFLFYDNLFDWLNKYALAPREETLVELQFEYINSGSSKCVVQLLGILEDKVTKRSDILIKWFYEEEDESMLEQGENYSNIIKLNFEMVKF